jgi:hypothetical protein
MVITRVQGRVRDAGRYVPTTEIRVSGTTPVNYLLAAYCAEFHKENPTQDTVFRLEDPDPVLACVASRGGDLSVPAMQAAVWICTDRVTYEELNGRFAVSPSDWSTATGVAKQCCGTGR